MNRSPSGKLKVTAPSDLEIVMTREFTAPASLVFDAFTKPEHVRRWFGLREEEMKLCEIDLRVGGKWRFVLAMGGEEDCQDGGEMGMYGEFLEIDPPRRIVQTENFEGQWFEAMGAGTINTLLLEERDGKTVMTSTVLYKTRQARDAVLESPMEEGAGVSFDRLEELLQTLA